MQRYCASQTLESVPCSLPSPCNVTVQMTLGLRQLQGTSYRPALLPGLRLFCYCLLPGKQWCERAVNALHHTDIHLQLLAIP